MTEEKKAPDLRFPGFTDPWEQRKLGDTFDFLQNNTLSRAELTAEAGAAKNVHYGDVLIKFGEYLDASNSALPYISSQQIADKFKGSLLQDGDVIMADTAEDETVGKCTEIAELQGFPTISGLHTIPMRPRQKFASGYLGYYMNSGSYHDQLLPLMQGIKVTSVSKSAILNTDISYPVDSNEQAKIGDFFIHLDQLITLHQRKVDDLKVMKTCLLQKLFPKEGENTPELRFPGFTDPWEQRKVSDLFETVESGNRLPKTMICKGNIPYVVASNENNGIVDYISENQNDFHGNRMKLFAENSITFSIDNPEAIFVQKVPFFTSNIMRVLHNDKYNHYHIVCFSELIKGLTSYYNWSFKFSGPVVMSSEVFVPVKANGNIDLAEIEKIGKTLSELDNLITLHQRKVDDLKTMKKCLLQKMFI